MSKVAELAYDIEQMYIEGYSPKSIAVALECPLNMVYDWLESNSLKEEAIDPAEWDSAFPLESVELDEVYSPFNG
jgi:DNA-directed RNA polymerase specialized sigma24 family protein